MYAEINLFGVPKFYIKKQNYTTEYIDTCYSEFDNERGKHGFKRCKMRDNVKIRKQFLSQYNFKIAFNTVIGLELYKQGRTTNWLLRMLNERGFKNTKGEPMNYHGISRRIRGMVAIEDDLMILIKAMLSIY